MEVTFLPLISSIAISIVLVGITSIAVKMVWLTPKKLEKYLKAQGFNGNPYRLVFGDMMEYAAMTKHEKPKHINLSDNVSLHALPSNAFEL